MAEGITLNGVSPTGNHEVEYEGDNRVIYDDLTLGDYDSASDGNGNTYDPSVEYGVERVKFVHVEVQAASYEAQYDYTNDSIRVYNLSDGTEVAQGTTLDIDLRVEIRGSG